MTVSSAILRGLAETCGACVRWTLRLTLVAVLGLGACLLVAADRSIALPDALVSPFETRLSAELPAPIAQAAFGEVRVALRHGAVPVLIVKDLRLEEVGGAPLATADRAEAILSRRALAAGQASPVALRAEGLALTATRDADGRVRLAAGGGTPPVLDAPDPDAALDRLAALLAAPPFDRLREVALREVAFSVDDAVRGRSFATSGGSAALRVGADGNVSVEADLGRFASAGSGASGAAAEPRVAEDTGGRVQARLRITSDGSAAAEVTVRGLVPAATAGVAGVTPLSDVMARIDAPVSMTLSGHLDARGALAGLSGEVAVGTGRVRVPGLAAPVVLETARASLTLGPRGDVVRLEDLSLATDRVRLSGRATLRADPGGLAGPVVVQAALHDLGVTLPDRYEAPLTLDALWIEARYDRAGAVLEVPAFTALRGDTKVTGRARVGAGDGGADGAGPRVALDVALAEVAPDTLVALWPAGVIEGTRDWLRDNVVSGRFTDVAAALRVGGGRERAVGLSFGFEDAVIRVAPGLPPIEGGRGVGGIDGTVLSVAVEAGHIAPDLGRRVAITDGLVRLPDIRERNGTLEVRLAATTDATGALSLLTSPAFRKRDAGDPAAAPLLGPGEAGGDVALRARMAIPLFRSTRLEDVDFAVEGEVSGFATRALLPGQAVEAALLSVAAGPQEVRIAGPARVAGVPVEVVYTRSIAPDAPLPGAARIAASGALGARTLDAAGLALPRGVTLTGAGRWRANVDLRPGAAPAFTAEADLSGAGLSIPALVLRKAQGSAGRVAATGRLGVGGRIDPLQVRLPGLAVDASVALGPGGAVAGPVRLSRLRLGDWLDVRARIDPAARRVALTGGRLDLRALPEGNAGGGTAGVAAIDVALDRVVLTDDIALTGVRGQLDGSLSGRLSAEVNGAAPVDLRLVQQDGGRALQATASDAGAVLRAAGAYGNLHGGALDLRLVPVGTGLWRGRARVADTTLRDGPVVAQILSGLSVVGALEQMQGAGIRFTDLRADFRLSRDAAVIDAASAAGPAIGVSLDGAVDFARRSMDLQGVVSPIFFLNRAGSFMTRRGEGLIGVSYSVTGPFDGPRVAVNPLSVLTPGFLREMFRRDRARMPEPAP